MKKHMEEMTPHGCGWAVHVGGTLLVQSSKPGNEPSHAPKTHTAPKKASARRRRTPRGQALVGCNAENMMTTEEPEAKAATPMQSRGGDGNMAL